MKEGLAQPALTSTKSGPMAIIYSLALMHQ